MADESTPAAQSSVLYAASKLAYMTCKRDDGNPEACLAKGEAVLKCTSKLLHSIKAKCSDEFNKYSSCLDYYSNNFVKCRPEQTKFEAAAVNANL